MYTYAIIAICNFEIPLSLSEHDLEKMYFKHSFNFLKLYSILWGFFCNVADDIFGYELIEIRKNLAFLQFSRLFSISNF